MDAQGRVRPRLGGAARQRRASGRGRFSIFRNVIEAGGVPTAATAVPTGWAIAQAKLDRRCGWISSSTVNAMQHHCKVTRDRNWGPGIAIASLADTSIGCKMA